MNATRLAMALTIPAALLVLVGCAAAATPRTDTAPPSTVAAPPTSGTSASPAARTSSTPVIGATSPPATKEQTTMASASVKRFLDATAAAAAAPKSGGTVDPALDAALGGALRADIRAQLAELADNGWTSTGTAVATGVRVLAATTTKGVTSLTVEACVDSSHVVVRDSAGAPLPTDPDHARAKTVYTVTDDGSGPLVTDRTFPTDPTC